MISGVIQKPSSTDSLLSHIDMTETFAERSKGLLGCSNLSPGQGLLITPCSSIHTFFMRITIDVLFLDKGNTVIGMRKKLKPYRFAMQWNATQILELMAGQIDISGIGTGDHLFWKHIP